MEGRQDGGDPDPEASDKYLNAKGLAVLATLRLDAEAIEDLDAASV